MPIACSFWKSAKTSADLGIRGHGPGFNITKSDCSESLAMAKSRSRFQAGPKSNIIQRRGVAWFSPETHARMREIMVECDFPRTFERWQHRAKTYENQWKSRGHLVVRVVIEPEEFLRWCSDTAIEPNTKALEQYVLKMASGVRGNLWDA